MTPAEVRAALEAKTSFDRGSAPPKGRDEMLQETCHSVSRTAKAEIHFDGFVGKGRYIVEKFDGRTEDGGYIFVKRQVKGLTTIEQARDAANRWIEERL
jgi:hypothetical protein